MPMSALTAVPHCVAIVCDDDEQAKRRQAMVDCHALELWQEACKIATFNRLRVWTETQSATSCREAARWALNERI
jgi:hypothetical protein